ncbi:hypothetical protein ACN38_g10802 [Penicillium nordicum]|uniref:Uncharacterized protein n=1 Tax=Penicillium nordicum TaxID=229535 RepID=A0A0M8P1A8_9EURO|nr:hypothetical protein ACN38_g10802 [Penicillium nordicum]
MDNPYKPQKWGISGNFGIITLYIRTRSITSASSSVEKMDVMSTGSCILWKYCILSGVPTAGRCVTMDSIYNKNIRKKNIQQ